MRVPASKVYRAFPELDRFSDQQCEGFVRSATKAHALARAAVMLVVGVGMLPGGCIGGGLGVIASQAIVGQDVSSSGWSMSVTLLLMAIGVAVPCVGALLFRDAWLRRVVRDQIDRCICPACRYSLLGLHPVAAAVLCPECGTRHTLASLGVSEQDLLVLAGEADGGAGGARIQSMMEHP